MVKTISLLGLLGALAIPQAVFADPSGYGTEGPYGQRLHRQAIASFQRDWNAGNEAKNRAERSAAWMRRHNQSFPNPF